ncbi:hypothetical protein BOTBODRAFT_545154 [Botryobasidium botryosum FD-172 SS1]|uniref:Uncharacterized protein n=1 Tax=Botryobasidium botryosum (strain FD-172 SS1) TaxID=930990 RepID=A0A067MQE9_BOTB1|nr:hypothetical protein BOTBODRAFT_545154 [Botryobasidium botryosum FD-172 SS1]
MFLNEHGGGSRSKRRGQGLELSVFSCSSGASSRFKREDDSWIDRLSREMGAATGCHQLACTVYIYISVSWVGAAHTLAQGYE